MKVGDKVRIKPEVYHKDYYVTKYGIYTIKSRTGNSIRLEELTQIHSYNVNLFMLESEFRKESTNYSVF